MQRTMMTWMAAAAAVVLMVACGGGKDDGDAAPADTSALAATAPGVCSYDDAGDGSLIEGAPGTRLTDSRGSSYDLAEDCTLTFVQCEFTRGDGKLIIGQPADAFVDSDGTPKVFLDDCRPGIDPSELPLSQELIDTCGELGGTLTAPDATVTVDLRDDWWTCRDVPLGETQDGYDAVTEQLAPFCVAPAEFTSGILSAGAPWYAGWSCSPAGTSSSIEAACAAAGGTLDRNDAADDWSCVNVPVGENDTDQYAEFDNFFVSFCAAPAELTSGILSTEPPWLAGWTCTPA